MTSNASIFSRASCAAALAAAALFAGPALTGPALAGSDYTPDQIVKFFAASADLGQSRGLCVGSVKECEAPKPAGFDMLINFSLDSADLTTQAQDNLAQFAKALKDQRIAAAKFVVEGYTDASGSKSHNQDLSERRAESVTAFLLDNGVSRDRLQAIGMGEKDPRVPNPMDPQNRRVEMRIKLQ